MIEARGEQEPALQRLRMEFPGVDYAIALLGRDAIAAAPFHVSATGSSIFAERSVREECCDKCPRGRLMMWHQSSNV
jgi:hypothetical protein